MASSARPGARRVALLAKPGNPLTGVGRYVAMLGDGLRAAGAAVAAVEPDVPPLPSALYRLAARLGADAAAFLRTYPVWARFPPADIYHLTSQNLASLLMVRRPPGPVVVTVHDIIPFLVRDQPQLSVYRTPADRLFDGLALRGLRRADHLIADSEATRQSLIERRGLAPGGISVAHLGIDHQRFRPQPAPPELFARYGLEPGRQYLIYVGSEDPRKNLRVLVRGLALLAAEGRDVALIKVGRAHFSEQRAQLIALAGQLGVAGRISFLDEVPEADLPLLYGLSACCVMPSLYEGFGFPLLEAMACGAPVAYALATSLPELAGAAGAPFDPHDAGSLAAALRPILDGPERAAALRELGLARAGRFTWAATLGATLDVYESLADRQRGAAR